MTAKTDDAVAEMVHKHRDDLEAIADSNLRSKYAQELLKLFETKEVTE